MESNVIPSCNSIISKGSVFPVMALTGRQLVRTTITVKELIGNGTFGRVYKAHLDNSEHLVALKQVDFDPNKMHIEMNSSKQKCLLMAMEYMPMTLAELIKKHRPRPLQMIYVRIISYQLFRGLGYLHSHCVMHRDIKPENMLIDPLTMSLKLADFGSAKFLYANSCSATYVCTRSYRAPELLARFQRYSTTVDVWSAGCVLAELLKSFRLFASNKHGEAQLLHMISVLGTDGLERAPQILAASGLDTATTIIPRPRWQTLIGAWVPQDLAALLDACLQYDPAARIAPLRACAHASYDELRIMDPLNTHMPNGVRLPSLFNFSQHELQIDPDVSTHLLPLHLVEVIEQ